MAAEAYYRQVYHREAHWHSWNLRDQVRGRAALCWGVLPKRVGRAQHMVTTIMRLAETLPLLSPNGEVPKMVRAHCRGGGGGRTDRDVALCVQIVWAHNSHVGDSRGVAALSQYEWNVGHMVRLPPPAHA